MGRRGDKTISPSPRRYLSLCVLTKDRARTGHSQKIVPGLEAFNHVSNVKPGPERSEGGHSQKIVPGLEAFNHVSNVKPGPERSEGPAFNIGPKP
jgi:hypothetical protein